MNNIYFFNHFNNLLKQYSTNDENINNLIKDKTTNGDILTQNELYIIKKYKDLHDISEQFLHKVSTISNDINNYLKENCNHDWNTDFIDIDLCHSKQIKYCYYCNTDFFDYNV